MCFSASPHRRGRRRLTSSSLTKRKQSSSESARHQTSSQDENGFLIRRSGLVHGAVEPLLLRDSGPGPAAEVAREVSDVQTVKKHTDAIVVYLELVIYSILDVKESDQTCITCLWTLMSWTNENIVWSPDQYCGINKISLPSDMLWKPDMTIEEISCRMQVYKFPFDTQSCNLTFRSAIYSAEELNIAAVLDSEKVSNWTRHKMKAQFEWLFIDMSVINGTVNRFDRDQDVIIFTINMKRRSVLYIVNFIFPVLFFLREAGFKITVLLAVTVMQLLLNEILPSSSSRIPLIAVYCIGIFSLMLLSLLESILVAYLINKDSEGEQEAAETQVVKGKYLPTSGDFISDKRAHWRATSRWITSQLNSGT
ncbi:hypothetical protein WMY93_009996 [Mugilogobius chulae]|uniref:Uncharacterized protein n=1 Tax=Mugilogobius chulae TaxID=88201 RepID=A0AAW0P5T1_9GOBI